MSDPGAIDKAEDWLVAKCTEVAGEHFKSIEGGPGDWSEAYLTRVLKAAPAIRVAWLGGPRKGRPAETLLLDSQWAVHVAFGWGGPAERLARRGKGARIGAYRACELLAPILNHETIPDVGQIHVSGIHNMWNGETDKAGIAAYAIGLEIPLSLDPDESVGADYADFLTAGIEWDLPGVGENTDAADLVSLAIASGAFSRGFTGGFS